MKKICFVFAMLLMILTISVYAEGIDLSEMSSDELIALSLEVQKAIAEKVDDLDSFMYPGRYIVGEDLEEGEYILSVARFPDEGDILATVYLFEDDDGSKEEIESFHLEKGEEHRLKVKNGNMIYIKRGVICYAKRK